MKFNLGKLGLSGQYRLVASTDPEGKEVTKDTGWFDNLITNAGLNRIGQVSATVAYQTWHFRDDILRAFRVGSGTTPPQFTDVALDAEIAAVSLASSSNAGWISSQGANYTDGYMHLTVTRQFGQGAAAGNLSEIGLGDVNNLFSRALILDSFGDPTTITILANEFLTVYYTLRVNIPQADQVISAHPVMLDGVSTPHDITIRPNNANSYTQASQPEQSWKFFTVASGLGCGLASNGGLVAATSDRGGTSCSSFSTQGYVADSYERWTDFYWDLNRANFDMSTFTINIGLGSFQFNIVPALQKNSTKVLNATFGYSWARA